MGTEPEAYPARAGSSQGAISPLRLAVFGWVQEGGGSVASAHYQLCRALLRQGHWVDFYAQATFPPDPGYADERYTYVPVEISLRWEIDPGRFPSSLRLLADRLGGRRRTREFRRLATEVAGSRHSTRHYDAFLFLGTAAGPAVPGVVRVAWPQGAPQIELSAVRGLYRPVTRVSGVFNYAKLRLYYGIKDRLVWRWARHCPLIVGSDVARAQAVSFGVPGDRICVAPYAVDLERFAPGPMPDAPSFRILCIGRLDPRKRVDLLVDAVDLLARRRSDFQVDVIGRDGYLPGWASYVEQASHHLPISYTAALPQEEIARRLREADLVVQPSEHEEFGHAVGEALASGVPVVVGPTNGTAQYVPADGAVIFESYEPASLAAAIDRGLAKARDPSARVACRRAASAFAADEVASTVVRFVHELRRGAAPEPPS